MNIRVLPYLDDFLFMASTSSKASAMAEFIMTEFRTLGLEVNYAKSVVNPTQRIEQLGMVVDTVKESLKSLSDAGIISKFPSETCSLPRENESL